MWFVYVAQSIKDGKLYTGISNDPEVRIKKHNQGSTRSTRSRRPFILKYTEKYQTRTEARKREKYLKSGVGREFVKSLIKRGGV